MQIHNRDILDVPAEKIVERVVQIHTRDIIEVPTEKMLPGLSCTAVLTA